MPGEWGICREGLSGGATFTLVGWGKLTPEVSGFKCFLFSSAEVATDTDTCFDEMEEFAGKDTAFVSHWFTMKGLQKLCSIFKA